MHGDFSRGHRPDRKRGRIYTRAFAQERRLLLDSDLNAATDALHERLRGLANHLGCPKGSPDLGYLVTPGRLLALFRELEGVVVSSANLTLHREYGHKYLDRYPSLHLIADQGAQGTVTLRLREPANGQVQVWCRRDAAAVVTFEGAALNVPLNADLQAVTANVANAQEVDITLDDGGEIWIGLIETRQTATLAPRFDYARGNFYLDGLPLNNPADATWVTNAPAGGNFQVNNNNLANGNQLLAYLEGWERHITFVEDLGLLERALGGDTDTMTRGRAVGQVKLAFVPANFDLEAFARALASPVVTDGTLDVTTPPAPPNPDPCALPVQGGYTGRDNRFYRFEVHLGGAPAAAVIKWSRDNGSELFAASDAASDSELTFPSNTPLQGGDLVEILTAETIDLGDDAPAVLDGPAGTFTPAVRSVGVLARLVGPTGNGGDTFTLTTPDNVGVLHLPLHYGPFPIQTLKVRRWHGLILAVDAPLPNGIEVENGLRIALNGTFTPGDYWQYEARAAGDNDNGPFQQAPHGPERDFAPLALLQFSAANQPLLLERWLDDRFVPICELTADDIAFDGDHIGSDSDTVQEIIEELWEKSGGGCCEFTLEPPQGDAAGPIRDILDATQGEVTICFEPGLYTFTSTLVIDDRTVILKGCPRAVFFGDGVTPIFEVVGTGRLVLDHLVVYARQADGTSVLIDVLANATGLDVRDSVLVAVPSPGVGAASIAIRVIDETPPAFTAALVNPPDPPAPDGSGPPVRLVRALVAADWGVSAARLSRLDVADSIFECAIGCIWAERSTQLDLRSSGLVAGADLAALAGWTSAELLAQRDLLFAPLGDLNLPGNGPADDSVCVWMGSINLGAVAGCQLAGGVGIAATNATLLNLHDNRILARRAIHIVHAEQCAIDGGMLLSTGGVAGVRVGTASGFSLHGCGIIQFDTGVELGAIAGLAERTLSHVLVSGNRIDDVAVGIQIGPDLQSVYAGQLAQVAITENTVRAATAGIVVNALTIGSPELNALVVQPVLARVADNMITARNGIGVSGRDVEVADNVVRPVPAAAAFFGIVGVNTSRLICEANHIEVSVAQQVIIMPFMAGGPGLAPIAAGDNFVAAVGAANVPPAAIVLAGGADARVANNSTHADAGILLRSLAADNHARLSVKNNDFTCGPSVCVNTDEIVFLDNAVAGQARISSSDSGQVADNRIRASESLKLDGDLDILLATGRWKVADNRADGAIRIVPTSTGGGFFPGWLDLGVYTLDGWRALDAIGNLANDDRFRALINRTPDEPAPGGGGPVTNPVEQPAGLGPGRASYAMGSSSWPDEYSRAMESFVTAGASETLRDIIGGRDIIIVLGQRETAYHLQCTANWSRDLEIGILSTNVRINTSSVVQVISNRADEEMNVKAYTHFVMALNVAGDYLAAGNPQTQAIVQMNLEI